MDIVTGTASAELDIRNSRFLAETFIVSAQEEARAILKAQKEKYAEASHVVHAFVIGPTGGILGCSDDGEPSGTAGRPVLEVLKGSGITNVLLTVTRWFGGTLLGTGGLVKAYTEAAKSVLEAAPRAELVAMRDFFLTADWDIYERIKREIQGRQIEMISEDFGVAVDLHGRLRESELEDFSRRITDLTSGRTTLVLSP
jgi:uncharacterized YigZ family protein